MKVYHSLHYSTARLGYFPEIPEHEGQIEGKQVKSYGLHGEAYKRPLVKAHPDTGRPILFVGRHAFCVEGMDPEESEALLAKLTEHVAQPERSYEHQWQVGDLVLVSPLTSRTLSRTPQCATIACILPSSHLLACLPACVSVSYVCA